MSTGTSVARRRDQTKPVLCCGPQKPVVTTEEPLIELDAVYDAIDAVGRPHLTATELSRKTDLTPDEARDALEALAKDGEIQRQDVSGVESVW